MASSPAEPGYADHFVLRSRHAWLSRQHHSSMEMLRRASLASVDEDDPMSTDDEEEEDAEAAAAAASRQTKSPFRGRKSIIVGVDGLPQRIKRTHL